MSTGAKAERTRQASGKRARLFTGKKATKPTALKQEDTDEPGSGTDEDQHLSGEAQRVMGTRSSSIARRLLEKAMMGHMDCADALTELANEEGEAKEVADDDAPRSQVLAWVAEPPWKGEADEEEPEIGSGSREAEPG
jgi:hypothetical protein